MPTEEAETKWARRGQGGFSTIELLIGMAITAVVTVIAILQLNAALRSARSDSAMRIIVDQMRQAREYSIANRRYVSVAFPIVNGQPQIVITQINTLTPGAGLANPVLSTVPISAPLSYALVGTLPDTPDSFGNGAPIFFGGVGGGPAGGMLFQSDGELVDGSAFLPINGTVFVAEQTQPNSARAVTILGTTGRVRGWRSTGTGWVQF